MEGQGLARFAMEKDEPMAVVGVSRAVEKKREVERIRRGCCVVCV